VAIALASVTAMFDVGRVSRQLLAHIDNGNIPP
jgi:hypothetical protein